MTNITARPISSMLLTSCVVATLGASLGAQDNDLRPSGHCLPPETAFAMRIPNGQAICDALHQNTKLGAVMLSKDRIERNKQIMKDANPEQWAQMQEELEKYGLTFDDLLQMLAGESGMAVVMDQDELGEPMAVLLFWIDPGQEKAQLAWNAIGQFVDDHAEADDEEDLPIVRVDLEVEGLEAMHLALPQMQFEMGEPNVQWPENFAELTDEERQQIMNDMHQQVEQGMTESVEYGHTLVARLGGRLLIGAGSKTTPAPDGEGVVEQATAVLARFIASHSGDAGGFAARIEATDGVAGAMPSQGVGMLEMYADLGSLLDLAAAEPEVGPVLTALGLDDIGIAALRMTLDGTVLRSGIFIAAPAPRQGIMSLLDQPELPAEVPAWVPADAVSYAHQSLDLAALYQLIKQMVLAQFGEPAEQGFAQIEMQVLGFAQADLPTVLASLGHQHRFVSFEPELNDADADANEPEIFASTDRMAIVWQLKDEAIWTRLIQTMSMMTQGMLQIGQEQGFTGWRFEQGPTMGMFVGRGYMVFGIGPGAVQSTLSALNNPASGQNVPLRGEILDKVQTMTDLKPGMNFQIVDGNRSAKSLRKVLEMFINQWADGALPMAGQLPADAIDQLAGEDGIEAMDAMESMLQALPKLMPSDEDIEGMFGPAATYTVVNEHGLVMHSVNELPAP